MVLSCLSEDDDSLDTSTAVVEDPSASLDNSLVGMLRTMRYGNDEEAGPSNVRTKPTSNRKKKRLVVAPGKSVTSKDVRPDENNNSANSMSEEIDDPDLSDNPITIAGDVDSSVPGPSKDPKNVATRTRERESVSPDISLDYSQDESTSRKLHIEPSNWLLTRLYCQRKKKYLYFIAVVDQVEPDLEVRYLKHFPGTKNIFVNPSCDEYSSLEREDIVKVLPEPELDRKCRMIFDVDVGLWPK